MCLFSVEQNVLIEIRFVKDFWFRSAVMKYREALMLSGMLLADDPYSVYHKIIYHDIRRYKNIRRVSNVRDRIIYVYGDLK
jgi:hypothetical protein